MWSVAERLDTIEAAEALAKERDFLTLHNLIENLPADIRSAEPSLQFHHFHALVQLGKTDSALEVRSNLQSTFELHRDTRLYRRYLNVSGILLTYLGDLGAARDAFNDVVASALECEDTQLLADSSMNLGVLADMCGRWDEALSSHWRSLSAYQRMGDHPMVAGCHHNIGMVYRQLGCLKDADSHFQNAIDLYQRHGGKVDVLSAVLERGHVLAMLGDAAMAEAIVRGAYTELRALNHRRLLGEAQRMLAVIMITQRRYRRASRYLDVARICAVETNNPMLEAEVAEAAAVLEGEAGRGASRRGNLEKAAEIYRRMGAVGRAHLLDETIRTS